MILGDEYGDRERCDICDAEEQLLNLTIITVDGESKLVCEPCELEHD